ncbi:hypothetical protein K449DRAFT_440234 [Hypoxylon sp. EC38]|nr:hypothetical protein K449DRAFT_440234 [Hypoxylon sp. EC38]
MLLPRVLRPIVAQPTPLSMSLTRLVLPIPARCLSTTTIQSREQPDLSKPTPPSSTESIPSPTKQAEPEKRTRLPYFVGRNHLNNLSVYHKSKQGGNLKLTLLKNGDGDLQALKRDIKESLQLNDGDISVNSITRHIVIRGHKKLQVLNFLHTMGF